MEQGPDSHVLFTADDVARWKAERAYLMRQREEISRSLAELDRKFEAVSILIGPERARALLGEAMPSATVARPVEPHRAAKDGPMPMTDTVLALLKTQTGGRSSGWLRATLLEQPDTAPRIKASPTILNNSLARLVDRKKAVRSPDGMYYHQEVWARIRAGEMVEERVENAPRGSFTARMHRLLKEYGKPFTAGDAMALAKNDDEIGPQVRAKPAMIYSWLGRELFKNKLERDGEFYRYPSEREEAPNGNAAGASFAGRGATLPFDDRKA